MAALLIPEPPAWISKFQNVPGLNNEFLSGLESFCQSGVPATDRKPTPLKVIPANIPQELKEYPQWFCCKHEWNGQKWTKPPFHPNGYKASKTNPNHYSEFVKVMAAYQKGGFDGIGFVLTKNDPFVAIDIDHCLDGTVLTEEAKKIIKMMGSYTEISPSGVGIRIFVKGAIPRNLKKGIEMYGHDSYVTVTGQRWRP
jgi:putative DNA primase/helicase